MEHTLRFVSVMWSSGMILRHERLIVWKCESYIRLSWKKTLPYQQEVHNLVSFSGNQNSRFTMTSHFALREWWREGHRCWHPSEICCFLHLFSAYRPFQHCIESNFIFAPFLALRTLVLLKETIARYACSSRGASSDLTLCGSKKTHVTSKTVRFGIP